MCRLYLPIQASQSIYNSHFLFQMYQNWSSDFLVSLFDLQKATYLNYFQFVHPQHLLNYLILKFLTNHLIEPQPVKSLDFHHQLKSCLSLSNPIIGCFQFQLLTALVHPLHFDLTHQSPAHQTHQVIQEVRLPCIISDHNFQHLQYLSYNKTANVMATTNQILCKLHHHKRSLQSLSF